jgi:hypothetical protein
MASHVKMRQRPATSAGLRVTDRNSRHSRILRAAGGGRGSVGASSRHEMAGCHAEGGEQHPPCHTATPMHVCHTRELTCTA